VTLFFSRPLFLLTLLTLIPLALMWRKKPTSLTPRRKRDALVLRLLTLLCLCLALSGAQIATESERLTVVFLLDRSLSTGGNSQSWEREFVNRALVGKEREDSFGVLLFGKDTGVELPAGRHSTSELGAFTAVVNRSSSQLTNALRLASTAFPGETARRLVVLTDGQSTEGGVAEEIRALSDAGVEVWLKPLPERRQKDLLLSRLETPSQVALDEPFLMRLVVESRGIESCRLLVTENGVPRQELNLTLRPGPNLFLLPQRKSTSGPVRYGARLLSTEDGQLENNKGESITLVGGEQTVLVLRQEDGPGALVPLLREAGLKAEAVQPSELPHSVAAWRDVSCLVIEDVDSLSWSKRLQTVVNLLVREGGSGLVMCGSDSTFGVGAYQKTPIEPLLPVELSIRRPKDEPLSALVQCLDKSGSMSGEPIRKAREAAIAAGETLSERDLLGVVGFDSAARWVVPLAPKGDGEALVQGVATLRAGGGTDLYPAFSEALDELESSNAPLKHIIVLSDGAVGGGNYDKLLKKANRLKVTVSAVAFGQGADFRFLEDLTKKGKGRLFRSMDTGQGSTLAQIFIRDTVLATGAGVQEKPTEVRPTSAGESSPILADINFTGTPRLAAHNMASSKGGTSKTLLQSPKRDPVLAVGKAGLGFTAAWLSDLGGDWARSWDQTAGPTPALSLLETILIRSIRSAVSSQALPLSARGNRLEVRSSTAGDLAQLEIGLSTRRPLKGPVKVVSIATDGSSVEALLHPQGPFRAAGSLQVTEPGSGLVLAQDGDGQLLARTNFSMPLAPEFLSLGTNTAGLRRWSQVPHGRFDPEPETVFTAPAQPVPRRTPLEHDLARGALLLLLLEIAVRRLPVPKGSKKKKKKQPTARTREMRSRFSRLRETKKAVSEKRSGGEKKLRVERLSIPPVSKPESQAPEQTEKSEESTLARLKRARKKKKS